MYLFRLSAFLHLVSFIPVSLYLFPVVPFFFLFLSLLKTPRFFVGSLSFVSGTCGFFCIVWIAVHQTVQEALQRIISL